MFRTKGWFVKGGNPYYRGHFQRASRISMLAFAGVEGFVDFFQTPGTFDRLRFFDCVRRLIQSGVIQEWPGWFLTFCFNCAGQYSVWILDGAAIHLDEHIVFYLRSMGIRVFFLPAYCPFYNPIEFLFGYVKKLMTDIRSQDPDLSDDMVVLSAMHKYTKYSLEDVFVKCGYEITGGFDPTKNLYYK